MDCRPAVAGVEQPRRRENLIPVRPLDSSPPFPRRAFSCLALLCLPPTIFQTGVARAHPRLRPAPPGGLLGNMIGSPLKPTAAGTGVATHVPSFGVIYADPPWRLGGGKGAPPYPMMATKDICALPVGSLAAPDCALLL